MKTNYFFLLCILLSACSSPSGDNAKNTTTTDNTPIHTTLQYEGYKGKVKSVEITRYMKPVQLIDGQWTVTDTTQYIRIIKQYNEAGYMTSQQVHTVLEKYDEHYNTEAVSKDGIVTNLITGNDCDTISWPDAHTMLNKTILNGKIKAHTAAKLDNNNRVTEEDQTTYDTAGNTIVHIILRYTYTDTVKISEATDVMANTKQTLRTTTIQKDSKGNPTLLLTEKVGGDTKMLNEQTFQYY